MTDRFDPIELKQLLQIIFTEFDNNKTIFGIPEELFFKPKSENPYKTNIFNQNIDTPIGVAAGPHSQMAQNIIGAWLMGSRYIELKTVQTLDDIDVAKPCIDMQDEGYNCEWSQELKIEQSFNEYLNAWIIIHLLHNKFGFNGQVNTIFNMSVGYNLEGILNDNVQWFFEKMSNCKNEIDTKIVKIKDIYPEIDKIEIPSKISDNITLSTMHGCPADEIESIASYLMSNKKLHTYVKLNPTLLGPEMLRDILNNKLNFRTIVPDIAFEHDLKYPDAVSIIKTLQAVAKKENLQFGLKLTNTLESENNKDVFGTDVNMMYMSGRSLHALSINLANKLNKDLKGEIPFSFSAGADAFNVSNVLACGFKTVTVSSDLLKPGGYMRLNQYFEEIQTNLDTTKASNIHEFISKTATKENSIIAIAKNLSEYATEVLNSKKYKRKYIIAPNIKTTRELNAFDCISAPCKDTCATNQDIPSYLYHTSKGDFTSAYATILETNPFPSITGMICDHLCQNKCTRVNYDDSLLIREVKRFISEQEEVKRKVFGKQNGLQVAIIGAGPSGLSCAYYLALAGFSIDVFESQSKAGGMVQFAVPGFRLTDDAIDKDFKRVTNLGVNINYNTKIDSDKFEELRKNYNYIYLAPGAQLAADFKLEGNKTSGVLDSLDFLFKAKEQQNTGIGKNVVIIGGGNTAMDAARTAYRLVGKEGKVSIIYRRTINEMPADQGEIKAVIEENMEIIELVSPEKIIVKDGKIKAILCNKMKLGKIDASGRPRPVKIDGSAFEIPCDTIIPALGQKINIDFIDNHLLESKNPSYQTKIEDIFIGGDAKRNASTAIIAISDGRRSAEEIINKAKLNLEIPHIESNKQITKRELMLKRAKRIEAQQLLETPLNNRQNFNLVSKTLDEKSIITEANRCLYCDGICNICTTVCPNFANYSYDINPVKYDLQKIIFTKDKYNLVSNGIFEVKQKYQILNIANFCNECGNCNTFCPTNSAPYKEKPKVFLTKESFDNAPQGYYMDKDKQTIYYKFENTISALTEINNIYIFESEGTIINLDKNFKILDVTGNMAKNDLDLKIAAKMSIVIIGLRSL